MVVTPDQIATLRYLIYRATAGNDLAKRIVIFLLNASNGLSKQVCVCLVKGMQGYSRQEISAAASALGSMISPDSDMRLNQLVQLMGVQACFSCQYGNPEGPMGFDGKGGHHRYTFWLGQKAYGASGNGTELRVTAEDLDRIDPMAGMLFENVCRREAASRVS